MTFLFSSPLRELLIVALSVGALVAGVMSGRYFRAGFGDADHPDYTRRVVLGFRRSFISMGCLWFVGGLLTRTTWPLLFALVFLFEELIETGIMLLALRMRRD